MKILIVDDSMVVRVIAKKVLAAAGHLVLESDEVQAGLALAETESPDLILLDLEMPKEDGFDFLKQKMEMTSIQNIPTIIMSAHDDQERMNMAKNLGAKGSILKPIRPTTFADDVLRILK
jgi:DNA-binding response OmpR family regulator